MGELLEPIEAYAELRRAIKRAGSQAAYARQVGISPQFLSDALNGTKDIPAAALADLGLVRVTRYQRKKGHTANG